MAKRVTIKKEIVRFFCVIEKAFDRVTRKMVEKCGRKISDSRNKKNDRNKKRVC